MKDDQIRTVIDSFFSQKTLNSWSSAPLGKDGNVHGNLIIKCNVLFTASNLPGDSHSANQRSK